MKHDEKARELVDKYLEYTPAEPKVEYPYAIECALIAVDEIIESLSEYDNNTEKHLKEEFPKYFSFELQNMDRDFNYWQEVRKAIEQMKN